MNKTFHTQIYDEYECPHDHKEEVNGILTCMNCSATYNEEIFEWESKHRYD